MIRFLNTARAQSGNFFGLGFAAPFLVCLLGIQSGYNQVVEQGLKENETIADATAVEQSVTTPSSKRLMALKT